MKRILLLLAGLFALQPLTLDAQVYRVDPVPSFSEVRAYEWNEQAGKADYGKRITLPADAEVRLLDTLEGHGGVLVRYEDRKVMMYPADLAWDDELNEEGMPDYITERTRLKGLGHFALHSGVSRWAHSYQPAWMIVIILLVVTAMAWSPSFPASLRAFLLVGGLIAVALIETFWGAVLKGGVGWLSDHDSMGWVRTFLQILGYFLIVAWQVVLVSQARRFICTQAGVEEDRIRLRWAVLLPLPLMLVVLIVLSIVSTDVIATLAAFGVGIAFIVFNLIRFFRVMGPTWGLAFLLLYVALLLSTLVLIPVTIMLGLYVLGVLITVGAVVFFIAWAMGDHVEKIDGKYYKVPNLPM